jgi:hypothetical protein
VRILTRALVLAFASFSLNFLAACGDPTSGRSTTPRETIIGTYALDTPSAAMDLREASEKMRQDGEIPAGAIESIVRLARLELELKADGTFSLRRGPRDLRIEEGTWSVEDDLLMLTHLRAWSEGVFNGQQDNSPVEENLSRRTNHKLEQGAIRFTETGSVAVMLKRVHAWRVAAAACQLEDQTSCPKTSPQRLTPSEVSRLRSLVTSDDYRHVPTSRLALLAQRLAHVFVSASTLCRLARLSPVRRGPCRPPLHHRRSTRDDSVWKSENSDRKFRSHVHATPTAPVPTSTQSSTTSPAASSLGA